MPDSQQILEAIDARLTEAREQVAALEQARIALADAPVAKRSASRTASRSRGPRGAGTTATPSVDGASAPAPPRPRALLRHPSADSAASLGA